MNRDRTPPQVTVEQLLRLKRTERPAPEFWQQFDRAMRVKQLAAIVEPRPWWAPFIRIGTKVARYQLPVGATAILALTFVTVREYQLPEPDVTYRPPVAEMKIDTMPGPAVTASLPAPTHSAEAALDDTAAPDTAITVHQAPSTGTGLQSAPTVASRANPVRIEDSPAARAIAANLAAVKASTPELVPMIERVPGMEDFIHPTVRNPAVVDPLARVQGPSESRRTARLLASALPSAQFAAAEAADTVSTDRFERRFNEDRLYDNISRFGVKADRVAFKF